MNASIPVILRQPLSTKIQPISTRPTSSPMSCHRVNFCALAAFMRRHLSNDLVDHTRAHHNRHRPLSGGVPPRSAIRAFIFGAARTRLLHFPCHLQERAPPPLSRSTTRPYSPPWP